MFRYARKKHALVALPPVIAAAAIAAALFTSGPPGGSASMLDMAAIPAASAAQVRHLDVGTPLTSAARHELGALSTRRVLAERAAARREARRDRRQAARAQRRAELAARQQAQAAPVVAVPMATGDPQQIAAGMLGAYGWGQDQFGCLDALWSTESGWNVYASNPSSGAYGIPQALPGSRMASAGADWQTDATVQITWGLGYIQGLYGSPCGAENHEQAMGWY